MTTCSAGPPPPPMEAVALLSSLLTVIITTSPTPSAPSPDLVSAVLLSFRRCCPGLTRCRVIVVFDTFDRIEPRARLKRGSVTAEGAENFTQYKENVKRVILREYHYPHQQQHHYCHHRDHHHCHHADAPHLVHFQGNAEYGLGGDWNHVSLAISQTEDQQVTFIEPAQRLGFGLAVRSALRVTATPYVWIHQHDWTLTSDIPLLPMLEVMRASSSSASPISSTSSPSPSPSPSSSSSSQAGDDAPSAVPAGATATTPPVKYICLPSVRMVSYAVSNHVTAFPELRALTATLKRDFAVPGWPPGAAPVSVPLTPLFFWHDKPHVASTAHYLERVFPSRLAVARGAFIEDTIGQRAREQMKRGVWARWACWLYYPDEGRRLCLKHLNGRVWKGAEFELRQRILWGSKDGEGTSADDGGRDGDGAEDRNLEEFSLGG